MKIGIILGASAHLEEKRYEYLKECGFSSVDFSMANTEVPLYLCSEEEFEAELKAERALAETAGIFISQVHGPWRCPIKDFTPEDRAERMEKMKKAIRGAAYLGAPNMVIHPIMPFGIFDISKEKTAETFEINRTFMRELADYAHAYGVTVCLENMPFPDFSLSKPNDILRMIRAVNRENFKMCLDTGHVNIFPDLKVAEEITKHAPVIRALHVHDNNGKGDNHTLPFFGNIDWYAVGQAIRAAELPCPFSYETTPSAKLPAPIHKTYLKSLTELVPLLLNT